jgi:hypothetical protein
MISILTTSLAQIISRVLKIAEAAARAWLLWMILGLAAGLVAIVALLLGGSIAWLLLPLAVAFPFYISIVVLFSIPPRLAG